MHTQTPTGTPLDRAKAALNQACTLHAAVLLAARDKPDDPDRKHRAQRLSGVIVGLGNNLP